VTAADPGTPGADAIPVLQATDITKHFPVGAQAVRGPAGGRRLLHAVDGVSLSLWPGRTLALVGESGSGKSTLARLLMGLYQPTSGQILLDGDPVRLRSRRRRRQYTSTVQMILQDPFTSLNPIHTIRYQLGRPLRNHGRRREVSGNDAIDRLMRTVQLTPSGQYLDKHPHELSGGQRQRVAIARALAVEPRVLLADEPVSMLDVSIRLGVLNLLDGLRESRDLAILYVTHDIASARYFAEDTAVMYAAEIVETGPSEQVTQHPAHPYTNLLISSAPDPGRRGRPAPAGTTDLPDLFNPPAGCRFAARCPHAMDICRTAAPEWTDLGGGHRVRCFLHSEGGTPS
jgi:peptide/nickel transport system ATP-binding protein